MYIFISNSNPKKKTTLLFAFIVMLSLVSNSKASKLIELEKNFVELLNSIRETPEALSRFMKQKYLPKFDKNIYNNQIKTKEGVFAAEDCIKFLNNMSPKRSLKLDQSLSSIASEHSYYMASIGKLNHYDKDLNTPIQRLFKVASSVKGKTAQIVARLDKKLKDLLSVIIFLLIDDEIPNRFNRKVLLSDEWTNIGLGFKFEDSFFYITVLQTEDIECDDNCKNKTLKIFEELPTQNLEEIDLKALQLKLFKKYANKLSNTFKLKAQESVELCPYKVESAQDNCLQTNGKVCKLCTSGIRLQDGKCESERNYVKDDNFCDKGCSHCNWEKAPNTGFFKKNCLICKNNFFRKSDFSDSSCHQENDLENSELLPKISYCENHDYMDLDVKSFQEGQIKCYLCKYGYTLVEENNYECVKQPSKLRKSFSNCRIIKKLTEKKNNIMNWQDSKCLECIEDPLLIRNVKEVELTEQKIEYKTCKKSCKNICSDKCDKDDIKCNQRCLRFCERKCEDTQSNKSKKYENVSIKSEEKNASEIYEKTLNISEKTIQENIEIPVVNSM